MDLNQMEAEDLRRYARDDLGLNFPGNTKIETMRDRIAEFLENQGRPTVSVAGKPPAGSKVENVTPLKNLPRSETVIIRIHEGATKAENRPVPVGVNGKVTLIKRGVAVRVPKYVAEALENAKELRIHQEEDENTGKMMTRRVNVQAYPFTYLPEDGVEKAANDRVSIK